MTEIVLGIALLVATFILGFIARKPAPIVPPIDTPIVPPEINYADTHKMDDDAMPRPAATHSAQQLRDWARAGEAGVRPEADVPPPPVHFRDSRIK